MYCVFNFPSATEMVPNMISAVFTFIAGITNSPHMSIFAKIQYFDQQWFRHVPGSALLTISTNMQAWSSLTKAFFLLPSTFLHLKITAVLRATKKW